MKKLISIIAIFIFSQAAIFSQNCLPEGITFTTQEQIDNFQSSFPGCTQIEGGVKINGDDINNLNGLNIITSIGENLLIGTTINTWVNPLLTDLTGLENLTSIGDDLEISGNIALQSLEGLSGITSINGNFAIISNVDLPDLSGLNNLNSVDGYFTIGWNEGLHYLNGMENLANVGIGVEIVGNLELYNLSALSNLTSAGEFIEIWDNPVLNSIVGLENIDPNSIFDLSISLNPSLHNCAIQSICSFLLIADGYPADIYDNGTGCNTTEEVEQECSSCPTAGIVFSNQSEIDNFKFDYPFCYEINGNVIIKGNNIMQLDGLTVLTSIIGGLEIKDNPLLTDITGLEHLTEIGGDLLFVKNTKLTNLSGLINLGSIGGNLSIQQNDVLTELSGLENIDPGSIVDLKIVYNDSLSSCVIYSICDYLASPNGEIIISNNAEGCNDQSEIEEGCALLPCFPNGIVFSSQIEIDSFQNDFSNCFEIAGDVLIEGNDISNLDGLSVLTIINGNLKIMNNPQLNNIYGLYNLSVIGGDLSIINNDNLLNISGIENLEPGSILNLNISNNDVLSNCNTDAICNYLAMPNGSLFINNNFYGCNSYEEVAVGCGFCLPNGILFSNQAQIDSFQNDYPGCNVILGYVEISWNEDITNFDGLNNITTILGSFSIYSSQMLNDLSGLENLRYVNGSLRIKYNDVLKNLNGFNGLDSIGGRLEIFFNDSLLNFSGLENLKSINYGIEIFGNYALNNLTALSNLVSIGNSDLVMRSNSSLINLDGLGNIDPNSINYIDIYQNSSLSSCGVQSICGKLAGSNSYAYISDNAPGCDSRQEVESSCSNCPSNGITFNTQAEIDNFQTDYLFCETITGNVIIEGNDISNLDGLNFVSTIIGNLTISNNPLLKNMIGFEGLNSVDGNLLINNNAILDSLSGLENLISINGDLIIENNAILSDISGLNYIEPWTITDVTINGNTALSFCAIDMICGYLYSPNGEITISNNGLGCSNPEEVNVVCQASPCFPNGIEFNSQESLNHFKPYFAYCSIIDGDVLISGSEIDSLNALDSITAIAGHLIIGSYANYNSNLTNLEGLNNLTTVGRNLSLLKLTGLVDLTGLENLTTIGEDFDIYGSFILTNLYGLDNLISIGQNFKIQPSYSNYTLTSLSGINNLSSIGGNLWIKRSHSLTNLSGLEGLNSLGGISLYYNRSLLNLSGLENLSTIAGGVGLDSNLVLNSLEGLNNITSLGALSIRHSKMLPDLNGINSLTSIEGGLFIYDNISLLSLDGLNQLASIGGKLWIGHEYYPGNSALTDISALENLTSIGDDLYIWDNDALTTLSGLDNLETIGKDLWIRSNDGLISLAGLESLISIPNKLYISYNFDLISLTGLNNITSVGYNLNIEVNHSLTSLSGLDNLSYVGGNLTIGGYTGNPSLSNIESLSNLLEIGGDLEIFKNITLDSLEGLDQLTSVGGHLRIYKNEVLTSLTGLENLNSIGGNLRIYKNISLTSLSGLDSIDAGSIGGLYIYENTLLSNCDVYSICEFLVAPNGNISIQNNASGCNNFDQVEAACYLGVDDLKTTSFTLYPNPTSKELFISSKNNTSINEIIIYNQLGQNVLHQNRVDYSIDVSMLEPGIYVIELVSGNSKVRKKLIIE